MDIRMNKKPSAVWEDWDEEDDEIEWFDFKYSIGVLSAQAFPEGYCKAVIHTQNPFTGEPRQGHKYVQLPQSKDSEELGASLLSELFKEVGTVEVYKLSNRPGLVFIHRHHDNPVNGDTIVVTPVSEKTYVRRSGK